MGVTLYCGMVIMNMDKENTYMVVLVTASSQEEASNIAKRLVEDCLAACVNILPSIRSIYRWQDKICDDQETLLIIKTEARKLKLLMDRVKEMHSYDLPEMIALPIVGGWEPYLAWLGKETANDCF